MSPHQWPVAHFRYVQVAASLADRPQHIREEALISEPTGHAMQKRRTTKGPRVNKRREYGMANRDCKQAPTVGS
jgi:hypothetical protein